MKLKELLKNVEYFSNDNLEIEIKSISFDSRESQESGLFVCVCGENANGHDFAFEAVRKGAVAIVCEKKIEISVPQVIVSSSRKALPFLFSNFYENPQNSLKIVGITGTNGKTTTSFLIKSILETSGKTVGLIGTQGAYFGNQLVQTSFTTPDPQILFKLLFEMKNFGIEYVVMEVSAHALFLEKVAPITFETAVFTNLTQDHLEFFKTMENYKNAKLKLFSMSKSAVLNFDDPVGIEIAKKINVPFFSFGLNSPVDIFALNIVSSGGKTEYVVNLVDNIFHVKSNLIGKFNVSNSLASAGVGAILGFSEIQIKNGLEALDCVPGRVNTISLSNGALAVIDFAHTPDGIEKILSSLKEIGHKRIITVFGCSGNKDKSKRRLMGQIAEKYSDFVVLTSDNPCFENPWLIIDDIEHGMKKFAHTRFVDRKDAVEFAIKLSRKGDVVAILGKSGENFQDINGVKIPYSDFEIVRQANTELKVEQIKLGGAK